jgi:hypothetical protein
MSIKSFAAALAINAAFLGLPVGGHSANADTLTLENVNPPYGATLAPSFVTLYGNLSLAQQHEYTNWYEVSPGGAGFITTDGPHQFTLVWGNVYPNQFLSYDSGGYAEYLYGDEAVTYPDGNDNAYLSFEGSALGLVNNNTHEPLLFTFQPIAAPELPTWTMLLMGLTLLSVRHVTVKAKKARLASFGAV